MDGHDYTTDEECVYLELGHDRNSAFEPGDIEKIGGLDYYLFSFDDGEGGSKIRAVYDTTSDLQRHLIDESPVTAVHVGDEDGPKEKLGIVEGYNVQFEVSSASNENVIEINFELQTH